MCINTARRINFGLFDYTSTHVHLTCQCQSYSRRIAGKTKSDIGISKLTSRKRKEVFNSSFACPHVAYV